MLNNRFATRRFFAISLSALFVLFAICFADAAQAIYNNDTSLLTEATGISLQNGESATTNPQTTIMVTSAADAGGTCPGANCTLRQAIATAVSGDTINFVAGIGPINLTSGELYIPDMALTIIGPGADLLTVQRSTAGGTPAFRIFSIYSGQNVTISGLTIANGNASYDGSDDFSSFGGGILYYGYTGGHLTVTGCTISANSANSGTAHDTVGGGIDNSYHEGEVTITNSTISGNSANNTDIEDGFSFGGGISNVGTMTISNSTISGNTASVPVGSVRSAAGGGIQNGGAMTISNSTISGNSATYGSGLCHLTNFFAANLINTTISDNSATYGGGGISSLLGPVNARNTIIAKNTAAFVGPDLNGTGGLNSQGYNLIGNNSGATITSDPFTDQIGTAVSPIDPLIGPLQNNGGPTQTQALLAGSTAIDRGHSSGYSTDQRGFTRPIDLPVIPNAAGGDGGDIGAFEAPPASCIPDMISWWPAEENALDILSHNDGTLQNGATFAQGEVGRAFSFDGVDDAVFVGNPPSLNVTSITIEAWVNTNNFPIGTINNVVAKWGGDGTVDSYLLGLINNGGVIQAFGAIGDGVTGDPGESGGSVSTNTWTHIAMTYNSVSGTNRLYLNGAGVASRTRTGGIYQTATNVYIGREDSPGGRFFNGLIDEPSIYNRALSGAEIQAIYDAGSSGKCTGGAGSISGTVTYGNAIGNPVPPRFVKNVSLSSTAGSPAVGPVITGTPGTYVLTGFGAGSYTIKPTKPGGSNTAITSNDAARVAQGVSGAVPFVSLNQKFASDASGNGTVSSNDAALIARFAAGLTGTGNVGQWKFFTANLPGLPTAPLPTPPYNDSRTYASVTSSLTGEDYVGLLIGEASGNYNPATHPRPVVRGQMSDVSEDGRAAVKPITVTAQPVVVAAGKEIVVPVSVEGVTGKEIISYEFDLRYDPAVIQPLENPADVTKTTSRGLSVVTNPIEPGLLRVVVYGPMPIDGDGVLLNLRFTTVGSVGSVSPLTFERIMFNEGELRVIVTDGEVRLF